MPTISLLPDIGAFQNIVALEGGGFAVFKTGDPNSVVLFQADGAGFSQLGSDILVPTQGSFPRGMVALPGGGFAIYFVHTDAFSPTTLRSLQVASYDELGVQTHLATVAGPLADQGFSNTAAIITGFAGANEQHWMADRVIDAGLDLLGLDASTGLLSGTNQVLDAWDAIPANGPARAWGLDGGAVVGVGFIAPSLQLFTERPGSAAPAPTYVYAGQAYAGTSPALATVNSLVFETSTVSGSGADLTVTRELHVVRPDNPDIVTSTISRPGNKVFLNYAEIEGFGFAVIAQFVSSATNKVTGAQIRYYDQQGFLKGSEAFNDFVGQNSMAFEFTALDAAGNDDTLRMLLTWRQEMNGPGQGFSMLAHVFEFNHFIRMLGTSESDYLRGFGSGDQIGGDAGNDSIMGFGGNDELSGFAGNDTVNGGDGNDSLFGEDGRDHLLGGSGHDTMSGEGGVDLLFGGSGNDVMNGGAGNDMFFGGAGKDHLQGDAGDDNLNGEAADDRLSGAAGEDNVSGGGGADVLFGGADNDGLFGGAGDDELSGGAGEDIVFGDEGIDKLRGQAGDDQLLGDAGNDLLLGGAGDDELEGGAGKDTLQGNAGADLLTGDGGADRFVFLKAGETSAGGLFDAITDFKSSEGDRIDLSAIDARTDRAGNNAFHAVADFTGKSGELRLQVQDGGLVVEGDVDGDGVEDFSIVVMDVLSLQQGDFIL